MSTTYEYHPAADLFPMMDSESLEALKADILVHGQQEPIVLFEGKILDGRSRCLACQKLNIEAKFRNLEACVDPIALVVSANLRRRHLSVSQRALIAAKLANGTHGGDRKSAAIKGSNGPLKTDDAAELLNVSSKTVKRAKEVLRADNQEIIAKVAAGELSVNRAAKAGKPRGAECTSESGTATPEKSELDEAVSDPPESQEEQRPPVHCDNCGCDDPQIEGRGKEGQLCPNCDDAWATRIAAGGTQPYLAPEQHAAVPREHNAKVPHYAQACPNTHECARSVARACPISEPFLSEPLETTQSNTPPPTRWRCRSFRFQEDRNQ